MVWFGRVPLAARALFIFACPFGSFLLAVSWSQSFLLGLLVGLAYGLPLGENPCWMMAENPVYWALIVCVIITMNYHTSLICMLIHAGCLLVTIIPSRPAGRAGLRAVPGRSPLLDDG